jgi:hypothetical protein
MSGLPRSTNQSHPEKALFLLSIGGAALCAQFGLGILVMAVLDWGAGAAVWALGVVLCGALTALGLMQRATRPVRSTVLLCVGALGPSLAMFWLPPVYLFSVATIVLAVATLPQRRGVSDQCIGDWS